MAKAVFHFVSGKSLCIEDTSKSVNEYYAIIAPTLKKDNIGFIAGDEDKIFVFNVNNIDCIKFEP